MTLIFGFRTCGRVYDASNQLIATLFFHLFFIPIFPVSSIRVEKKRLLHDEGEPTDLSWVSMFAAYARVAPIFVFWNATLAFIHFLFLERHRNYAALGIWGTVDVLAFSFWVYALFGLGARRDESRLISPSFFSAFCGFVLGGAVLSGMFIFAPREIRTPQDIVSDRSLSDEAALAELGQSIFGTKAKVQVHGATNNLELQVNETAAAVGRTSAFAQAGRNITLENSLKDIVKLGARRGLKKITVVTTDSISGAEIERLCLKSDDFGNMLVWDPLSRSAGPPPWTVERPSKN